MDILNQNWNLDPIFQGGSASNDFEQFLNRLKADLSAFQQTLKAASAPITKNDRPAFLSIIHTYEDLLKRLNESIAFIDCITSQDVKDNIAKERGNQVQTLGADFETCSTLFDHLLNRIADDDWQTLLEDSKLTPIRFVLQEKRDNAREKLPAEQEELISSLAIDGYHGWGDYYYTIIGNIEIPFEHPEKGKQLLSVGQTDNLLNDPDRAIRKTAFDAWETAWDKNADFLAATLNHLAGFRLKTYEARGWTDILKEPLAYNRMSRQTLDAMWQAINDYKPVFVKFLNRKAKLLGLKKLSWFDVEAPLETTGKKITYEQAADFVIRHFHRFNPKMADFAEQAITHRWIEAENRPGKRPGGFCTSFPLTSVSRIFMTFSGTASNTSTLAHELGHAYHQSVMDDMPYLSQQYAMNVAETASTFSEMIVGDAAKAAAETKAERIAFLEDKLQRSIAFFMDIHARFLFETRFYEERKKGIVGSERLNRLMLEAQKEAYLDSLDVYHPSFWESKLHFYITDVPFYNFPYTFGYLFSTGIYVQALKEGASFAGKYDALLRDTGSMTVEALAEKHLGADLTAPDFWRSAVEYSVKDVQEFLALTE